VVLSPAVAASIKPPAGSIRSFVALGGARGGKQHGRPQQGVYPYPLSSRIFLQAAQMGISPLKVLTCAKAFWSALSSFSRSSSARLRSVMSLAMSRMNIFRGKL
jgi:hypothetical protein